MSDALEQASLIMVPSGYENGTLGSLKPTDGTGDFTFSRGSDISATRVNEQGYIEKGYENLLLNSNLFDNGGIPPTIWSTINTSVVSGQSGYDGSSDAYLLSNNSTGGYLRQVISVSGVNTFSVYVKAGNSNWVALLGVGAGAIYFDLQNGVSGIGATINSIEPIGNDGWYRCSITTSVSISQFRIYAADGDQSTSASSSVYIQDAMLNQGLVAYPYVETTTAPVAGGILEDMPRLDYSDSSCPALLLEPQRTNLVPSSEYLSSIPWNSNTLTFSWDTSLLNLEGYYGVQKVVGIGTAVYNNIASGVNTGEKLCYSIWAKSSSNANFKFGGLYGGENATFDVSTGNLVAQGIQLDSYEVIEYGNGWRRYIIVINYSGAGGNKAYGHIEWNDASQPVYLYGFQLEQDATYPTSYIPTYGTSQTRLAEDLELPSLSSVFDSSGDYTCFFEVGRLSSSSEAQFLYIRSAVFNYITLNAGTKLQVSLYDGIGTTSGLSIDDFIVGTTAKAAVKVEGSTSSIFINGEKIKTSNVVPRNFDRYQKNINHLKYQEVYFPTALSDDECIALTTIS